MKSTVEIKEKNRTRKVTINVTDEFKELYDMLSSEYSVAVNVEMWKVMSLRLKEIAEEVVPKAS
jgi:hypothetical protein